MKLKIPYQLLISAATVTVFWVGAAPAWSQPAATTTTLGMTAGGNAVTTVSSGSMVTLTATVVSGTTSVTVGQVNICDATAKYCTDVHLLGTAQLIQAGPSAGTAVFRFIPGIGSHRYKAVFAGTPKAAEAYAGSTSSTVALAVTGKASTTTAIAATGSTGNYTLTAAVDGTGTTAPTGTLTFLDTSNANAVLGTAMLGAGSQGLGILASNIPLAGFGPGTMSMATGDFNGDGILDLAVVDIEGSKTALLLGNGDGTFKAAPASLPVGLGTAFVVVGDFNGDGIADLAILNSCGSDPSCSVDSPGSVNILLGDGDATFTAVAASPATGTDPSFMVTADFNGDGIADLAVANNTYTLPGSTTPPSNPLTILLGNGDGTFKTAASPAISNTLSSMVVGDFNGDGIPDLAVATEISGGTGALTVLLGNGDGTFTAAASPTTGNFKPLVAGDFNGDGKLDLVADDSQNGNTPLLLGNGDGTFTATGNIVPIPLSNPVLAIAVGDFNGDGIADLGVIEFAPGLDCTLPGNGQAFVYLGNGQGMFTEAASGLNVECGETIVVGDFNGGGIADLAETGPVLDGNPDLSVVITQLTGTATATGISLLGTGTHQVEASYSGDGNYGASTSATTALTAQQAKPTVTVTPSATSITTAQTLSVTVVVTGAAGNPTPTGSVTLTSGTYASAATTLSSLWFKWPFSTAAGAGVRWDDFGSGICDQRQDRIDRRSGACMG